MSAKAKDDATSHLANGVEVTPLEVKQDDNNITQLLDAKIWKFDVTCPMRANTFALISIGQNGKPFKVVAGGIGTSSAAKASHSEYTIGLMPIAGTFNDAKELKYICSVGVERSSGTIPNFLIHSHGYTQDAQVMASDNRVLLMSGNLKKTWISSPASQNEVALALEFQVDHYKK